MVVRRYKKNNFAKRNAGRWVLYSKEIIGPMIKVQLIAVLEPDIVGCQGL